MALVAGSTIVNGGARHCRCADLHPRRKQQIEAWALGKAQSEHPNDRVSVPAYDFTDHEGRARCTAVITQRLTARVEDIKLVHHAGSAGLDDVDAGANEVGHSSEGFTVAGEQPSLE
jgi:hypothetical protein